jgi:hypothetical protein
MAEHPEEVLPEQRLTARSAIEEMCTDLTVHPQHKEGKTHSGHGKQIAD